MANFVLYDLGNSLFHNHYEADEKKLFGGPWGDESKHVHAQVPDAMDWRKCDFVEVVLGDGQTEDDIDFDHKAIWTDGFTNAVKYYKFELNATKGSSIDALDALEVKRVAKNAKKAKGNSFKKLAADIYDIMKAHSFDNNLTGAQISQLKTENATLFQLLMDEMPITAKPLIDALVADGTLITQDMLDDIALEYEEYGEAYPDITVP